MSVSDTPLFQTLASADIEHLMNKEIEHVKSIVEFDVSYHFCKSQPSRLNDEHSIRRTR